jgi:hypothetical protein
MSRLFLDFSTWISRVIPPNEEAEYATIPMMLSTAARSKRIRPVLAAER